MRTEPASDPCSPGTVIAADGAVSQFNGAESAAQKVGVALGSRITAVNGTPVASKADIVAQLGSVALGDAVAFSLAVPVDIGAEPPAPAQPPRPARPAGRSSSASSPPVPATAPPSVPSASAPEPAPSAEEGMADVDADVLAVQGRFSGLTESEAFAVPGRRLTRNGRLRKHNTKGGTNECERRPSRRRCGPAQCSLRTDEFLLFNDILIYASVQPVTGRHSLHGRLELCDCRVSVVPPGIDPEGTCFMLENPKKPFRVEAKTAQESTEWRVAVEAAIVVCGGTKSTERRKIGGGAAVITVEIVSARVVDTEGYEDKKYVLFDVLATNASTEQSHREEKRFSQFAWLHKRLSKELSKSNSAAAGMLPALPSKTVSVASNFSSFFFYLSITKFVANR